MALLGVLTLYFGYGRIDLPVLLLLAGSVMLLTAGGCVVNDYFDVKIDRIVSPDTMIVTRHISRDGAMHYFYALTLSGIALGLIAAFIVRSTTLAGIVVVVPGLLWFYSSSYKRILLLGDIVMGCVVALIPIVIALIANTYETYVQMGYRALQMMIGTWLCMLLQGLEQQAGDREMEVHTPAVVWGEGVTKFLITIVCVFFLAATVLAVVNY